MAAVPRIRILIADDHSMFRDGLRRLLEAEPGFEVVGEAGDGQEALTLARELTPDLMLLDVAMPRMRGMDVLQGALLLTAPPRVLLLTAAIDTADIIAALHLGARGVVLKTSAIETLVTSIQEVNAGRYWVNGEASDTLGRALGGVQPSPDAPRKSFGLTKREMEIVAAVASGRTNKDVARQFRLSEDTVKHHLTNIFDKTGASTRLELALFAIYHRLVPQSARTPPFEGRRGPGDGDSEDE